jgi:hypothetical protein
MIQRVLFSYVFSKRRIVSYVWSIQMVLYVQNNVQGLVVHLSESPPTLFEFRRTIRHEKSDRYIHSRTCEILCSLTQARCHRTSPKPILKAVYATQLFSASIYQLLHYCVNKDPSRYHIIVQKKQTHLSAGAVDLLILPWKYKFVDRKPPVCYI